MTDASSLHEIWIEDEQLDANPDVAKHLRTLRSMKTKAGYTAIPVSGAEDTRAGRAARALVTVAEKI